MVSNEAKIVVLATLPLWIGAVWLVGLRRPEPGHRGETQALALANAPAARSTARADEAWPGVVVSGNSVELGAEVSGTISESWLQVGARVREGAPLVRIDESSAVEDVRVARAKLEQQRSLVARAEADLAEASDLVARLEAVPSGVSQRQLLAARTRLQQSEAALREAHAGVSVTEASLDQQRKHQQKHVLRAPFSGVVVERRVDLGALVAPGQVLARIIDGEYYVRFALPEQAARRLAPSEHVSVEFDGRAFGARVSDIAPEVDGASQLVFARAKLELAAPDRQGLIAGTSVNVRPLPASAAKGID